MQSSLNVRSLNAMLTVCERRVVCCSRILALVCVTQLRRCNTMCTYQVSRSAAKCQHAGVRGCSHSTSVARNVY